MKTETVTISKFKATCLGLLKQVRQKGVPILVTLKGEPVAMVVPPPPAENSGSWLGSLQGSGKIVADIVAPATEDVQWKVLQE